VTSRTSAKAVARKKAGFLEEKGFPRKGDGSNDGIRAELPWPAAERGFVPISRNRLLMLASSNASM
jgi:hypothetical protein